MSYIFFSTQEGTVLDKSIRRLELLSRFLEISPEQMHILFINAKLSAPFLATISHIM